MTMESLGSTNAELGMYGWVDIVFYSLIMFYQSIDFPTSEDLD